MTMTVPITLVLADDHALIRDAMGKLLSAEPDLCVLAEAQTADEAVTLVLQERPAIVLLDIDMPGRTAFDAARIIRSRSSATQIIFLSAFTHDRYIEAALAAGASAYLTKSELVDTVINVIRIVARGGVYFSQQVRDRIVIDRNGPRLQVMPVTRTSTLTPRELEVLSHLASGLSKKEIAEAMSLSVGTVNNHTANLMAKLEIHDRVELARFAIREGLVKA